MGGWTLPRPAGESLVEKELIVKIKEMTSDVTLPSIMFGYH